MAKATDIEISPWEPYARAGARIVRVRTDDLFAADTRAVLDTEEIEGVHEMRVASRRLRAVLEVFEPCFPAKAYKSVLRDVKRLADALGERRDPDVHIAAMSRFARHVADAQRPGVERLVLAQEERQGAGNVLLAAVLQEAESSDLRGRLHALADAVDGGRAGESEPAALASGNGHSRDGGPQAEAQAHAAEDPEPEGDAIFSLVSTREDDRGTDPAITDADLEPDPEPGPEAPA